MAHEVHLFSSLKIKNTVFKNRIWVSPMCQYSSKEGHPTDWHFVHLGSRAVGGAGLILVEATGVSPEARISPDDSGIWSDDHIASFHRITEFLKANGSVSGIQLAHAGRKGSIAAPWLGDKVVSKEEGGWQTWAPSAIPFRESDPAPKEMTRADMLKVIADFESATERSLAAGFEVLEIHMAHGYLLHQFLSPLSNFRQDEYGETLENRMRFPLEVARAVRKRWPENLPLFVRISATDWAGGPDELNSPLERLANQPPSWILQDAIIFSQKLKEEGIDLIDCSSGGTLPHAKIPAGPGYQTLFAEMIRRETNIMTAAVGMITEPAQAESILLQQQADAIFMARESLRNPYWPLNAANYFGIKIEKPKQYGRA